MLEKLILLMSLIYNVKLLPEENATLMSKLLSEMIINLCLISLSGKNLIIQLKLLKSDNENLDTLYIYITLNFKIIIIITPS